MSTETQLLREALQQIENLSGGDSCEYRTIALNALAKAEALSRSEGLVHQLFEALKLALPMVREKHIATERKYSGTVYWDDEPVKSDRVAFEKANAALTAYVEYGANLSTGEQAKDVPIEWRSALVRLAFAAKNSIANAGPDPLLKAAIDQACLLLHDPYRYTTTKGSNPVA
jgi:hypothetical protein